MTVAPCDLGIRTEEAITRLGRLETVRLRAQVIKCGLQITEKTVRVDRNPSCLIGALRRARRRMAALALLFRGSRLPL